MEDLVNTYPSGGLLKLKRNGRTRSWAGYDVTDRAVVRDSWLFQTWRTITRCLVLEIDSDFYLYQDAEQVVRALPDLGPVPPIEEDFLVQHPKESYFQFVHGRWQVHALPSGIDFTVMVLRHFIPGRDVRCLAGPGTIRAGELGFWVPYHVEHHDNRYMGFPRQRTRLSAQEVLTPIPSLFLKKPEPVNPLEELYERLQ